MSGLAIPVITADDANLSGALKYAKEGFYVGPAKAGSKNPGSVLGKGWQHKTSRDPQVIAGWFAGTDHDVFIHLGRSGALAFDVDHPENLAPPIQQAIKQHWPPYQSTRPDEPGRGHYIFAVPDGRRFGNGLGALANGWGELRGENGVIMVKPSRHPSGEYDWGKVGPVPVLPGYLATQLPEATEAADAATDAQVSAFLAEYRRAERPELLDIQIQAWQKKIKRGESRHSTVMGHLTGAMKEARAGLVDAQLAADTFQSVFEPAVMADPVGPKQSKARSLAEARDEWRGILAWAVAQAIASDPDETRARAEKEAPPQVDAAWQPDGSSTGTTAEPTSLILPESFYQSRPVLQRIRDYAHSRGAAADMVLYGVLSRIAGMLPTGCRLETGIGSTKGASLNLFVAAIGDSAGGKSTGAGVSRDMYSPPPRLDFIDGAPLGTGEGLAEAYIGYVHREIEGTEVKSGPRKGQPRLERVREQVRRNAFYFADEGELLTKLLERNGSTIGVVIRTAWYGGTLGNTNADPDRNRIIPEGNYSMGMFIGFQPDTAQPLLADSAAGTTQRFVYCSATDPNIPATRPRRGEPPTPTPFVVQPKMMHLPDEIADLVWTHHHDKVTGAAEIPRLDGHGMLTRLKLAALLALLDSRHEVSTSTLVAVGDWELTEIMWQTSCKVRDHYLKQAELAEARDRHNRNLNYADREEMAEIRRQQVRDASTKVVRLARLIGKYVHDPVKPAQTTGDVHRRLRSTDRAHLDEALSYAASEGWVEVDGNQLTPGPSQPAESN
jgi:hypothetical protein